MRRAGAWSGYTLIELLMALAISAVLLTVAIPNLRDFVRENRLRGAVNSLTFDAAYARSEAIKQVTPVILCKSIDGASCATAVGTSWSNGWIVFLDADRDNIRDTTPAPGERILVVREKPKGDLTITTPEFQDFVAYRPDGSPNRSGRFEVLDGRGDSHTRVVCVSAIGRIRAQSGLPCPA